MVTDDFASHWQRAGRLVGFAVEAPFELALEGTTVHFPVRLPDFGAPNGMVLAPSYALLKPYCDALVAAGYGYSALSEPTSDDIDAETIVELLTEWGWSRTGASPEWLGQS